MARLSSHSKERIEYRLSGIVTVKEVLNKVNGLTFCNGQTYVKIKSLKHTIRITEDDGTVITGNTVYAIVKQESDNVPVIATVILRCESQKEKTYKTE